MNLTKSRFRTIRLNTYILVIVALLVIAFKTGTLEPLFGPDNLTDTVYAVKNNSDLDHDGDVDIDDLAFFSTKWLKADWQTVDWCQFLQQDSKIKTKMGQVLMDFTLDYFKCNGPDPLIVINKNRYPTRLAYGPNGKLFVSDAKIGSVFIYDTGGSLIGEIKGTNHPLGVAVDNTGNIYVGSNGDDTVKVYNSKGEYVKNIGSVGMPNDMLFDKSGNLYVVDSVNNAVKVYDPQGNISKTITARVPIALTIKSSIDANGQEVGELFVAEIKLTRISVFDLNGVYDRSFGEKVTGSSFNWKWQGKFVKLQSLAFDQSGLLHVADCYMNKVQILNPDTGAYINSYGAFGTGSGELNMPLHIAIKYTGQTAVANTGNQRVEIIGGW
ncbi:MAG: hypothetical protein FVQ84_08235 [Planctomycetes bacterium]|nr:hypothetical protein [Planctomycetota bacterium]